MEFSSGEIAGHLHPSAKIRQRGKALRRRCFIGDEKRIIMPAFGAFTGGLNVLNDAYMNLFNARNFTSWMLSGENVFEIEGHQLAT